MYLHTDGNIDTSIISPLPKVSFYFLSVVTLFLNSKKFDSHFPYLLDGTLVHNQSLATDTVCHPPPPAPKALFTYPSGLPKARWLIQQGKESPLYQATSLCGCPSHPKSNMTALAASPSLTHCCAIFPIHILYNEF